METVSQDIRYRVETIKQMKELLRGRNDPDLQEERLMQEKALKSALQDKIRTSLSIRVHIHFLQFCTWLNGQEETGSTEERLFWERNLFNVQIAVKSEIEGALREVNDLEEGHPPTGQSIVDNVGNI